MVSFEGILYSTVLVMYENPSSVIQSLAVSKYKIFSTSVVGNSLG
jgi:hypothetical protein